ncbi:MAG: hypothetical protein IJ840_02250 [Bacteroidales bacterium]|nr:hypothetical protein [Bacteroidales bacterium]
MRHLALLFSFILSLLSGGTPVVSAEVPASEEHGTIIDDSASANHSDYTPVRDICLTAAQGYSFSGNSNSNSVSLRTNGGGRVRSQQTKSSSRIVKDGKVIDNNNTHPFLAASFFILSGTRSFGRYLHSLGVLRL